MAGPSHKQATNYTKGRETPSNPARSTVALRSSATASRCGGLSSCALDRRVAARFDADDVLQETYLEAVRRLPGAAGKRYLRSLERLRGLLVNLGLSQAP